MRDDSKDRSAVVKDTSLLVQKLAAALSDHRVNQIEAVGQIPEYCANSGDEADPAICFSYHPFLIGDGCLGIPIQTLPVVLKTAFGDLKTHLADGNDCSGCTFSTESAGKVAMLTLCIVACNADHHTAWNWRKRLIADGHVSPESEIRVLTLLSTYKRHCKASLLWHHRQWVVSYLLKKRIPAGGNQTNFALQDYLIKLLEQETAECNKSCIKYSRNYHCWVYRWWCFNKICQTIACIVDDKQYPNTLGHVTSLYSNELALARKWVANHPTDFAACHYLHLLAELVCSNSSDAPTANECRINQSLKDVALEELKSTEVNITSVFMEYESVWHHRRWCIITLAKLGLAEYVQRERRFARSLQNTHKDNNEAVVELIRKHRVWLDAEFS